MLVCEYDMAEYSNLHQLRLQPSQDWAWEHSVIDRRGDLGPCPVQGYEWQWRVTRGKEVIAFSDVVIAVLLMLQ